MKQPYNISYRKGSHKVKHVDINKYNREKGIHERIISLRIDPPINENQFMIPPFMEIILGKLINEELTIKGLTKFKKPRGY